MSKKNNQLNNNKDSKDVILRQVTDHIFQSMDRIKDDIEYIVFLRKNTRFQEISADFYMKQIDRFARDVLITFGHLLDNDKNSNTLQSLINEISDSEKQSGIQKELDSIRSNSEYLKKYRNKIIAHHDTSYNASLGDYYPVQLFNYVCLLDPCFSMEILEEIDNLMGKICENIKIDGIGMFVFGGNSDFKKIFKSGVLGHSKKTNTKFIHDCSAHKCILK